MDILILNTAVVDFRCDEFEFVEKLAGKGGLARCKTEDMPGYTQQQYQNWINAGKATAGGPGNTAPLTAKAGIKTAVGVNLGRGEFDGLDVQGRYFYDVMAANDVDISCGCTHPTLPTGTTFVYDKPCGDRGGIAYFPNANNDFDFEYFKPVIEKITPKIVYYMYSGLSDRGDANEGRDLAGFMAWCRDRNIITIADSHTLAGNPEKLIESKASVPEYKMLTPLLAELDIFFTSYDEARMIENTLGQKGRYAEMTEQDYIKHFLRYLSQNYWKSDNSSKVFGVTVKDGAFVIYRDSSGNVKGPEKVTSRFMMGDVCDLVGAGDSFRAGFVAYVAKNSKQFRTGSFDMEKAVQMGNLFASLYIKAPLDDRYSTIGRYEKLADVIDGNKKFNTFEQLVETVL